LTIEVLAVALVAGTAGSALVLAVWLDLRRSAEPGGPYPVATDSALEAEQQRLADLKAELAAAETRTAERERQISAAERKRTEAATELAKQEAALAQRERDLQRSLADADRSAAEATARIDAREAVLATREAGLQQQEVASLETQPTDLSAGETELEQRDEHVAEHEVQHWRESDWWEKQLGRPLSAKK
jgi:chromosome segregation ATPase